MAFEHVALVDLGVALDAVSQVDRLFFRRHLPGDFEKTGLLLANRRVPDCLPNRKLKRHDRSFRAAMIAWLHRLSCHRTGIWFSRLVPERLTFPRSAGPVLQ